jgi:HAD superfamily hydrolase (TIGR01509 family)
MLRGAIFDMDGVLVDNMGFHLKALSEYSRRLGAGTIDRERLLAMNGMGNAEFLRAAFPEEIIEREGGIAATGAAKEALYREIYGPQLAPARGLVALLGDLRAHGVRLAVGTSAITANLDFVLDGLDIRRYFDALVTSDMVTRTKPDPEIYLRALSELGLSGGECLVFEDAVAGIEAASAAGIRSVALATSLDKPTLDRVPGVVLSIADFTEVDFATLDTLL